ncbi:MAG: SUMF1/EgtB/PvdO family nonheme iron enzyme [Gemmatimonadetes bacterium]|mgnify:FL=1|jgi:formylglycine-generating enzyme required for sulfatase activity|nr:SUMF1/EgtB/PvdO family nonheme iron enzyme [Gemmatimonadota bacterium]MBT6145343.1 SUMF1/EgtB/PvdO family nonheme iron enzyme [Gemmatimonadota bacterium]MBT7859912.1 SUMF1/EgtB/PvdO family nonheme iron enzyme [Gemmatimonadota bacterium]
MKRFDSFHLLCTLACLGVLVLSSRALAESVADESTSDEEVQVGTFYIDLYEYPNRLGHNPLVDITFDDATQRCVARGKRLCTEREWELACRGPDHTDYGYGDTFIPGRCNTPLPDGEGHWRRDTGTQPSGTHPDCRSPSGAIDMVGNVWEWTDGFYDREQRWRVVRGGSWFNNLNFARADGRYGPGLAPDYRLDLIGFRCCRDADK